MGSMRRCRLVHLRKNAGEGGAAPKGCVWKIVGPTGGDGQFSFSVYPSLFHPSGMPECRERQVPSPCECPPVVATAFSRRSGRGQTADGWIVSTPHAVGLGKMGSVRRAGASARSLMKQGSKRRGDRILTRRTKHHRSRVDPRMPPYRRPKGGVGESCFYRGNKAPGRRQCGEHETHGIFSCEQHPVHDRQRFSVNRADGIVDVKSTVGHPFWACLDN